MVGDVHSFKVLVTSTFCNNHECIFRKITLTTYCKINLMHIFTCMSRHFTECSVHLLYDIILGCSKSKWWHSYKQKRIKMAGEWMSSHTSWWWIWAWSSWILLVETGRSWMMRWASSINLWRFFTSCSYCSYWTTASWPRGNTLGKKENSDWRVFYIVCLLKENIFWKNAII